MLSDSLSLGILFIIIVSAIWAGASVLVQYIYDTFDVGSPFLLSYVSTSTFFVFLPFWYILVCTRRVTDLPWKGTKSVYSLVGNTDQTGIIRSDKDGEMSLIFAETPLYNSLSSDENEHKPKAYGHREAIKIALVLCPIWILSDVTYNLSLKWTSVSSSTVIASTSSLFAFVFSLLFKIEKFDKLRLIGVILSISGAALVSLSDKDDESEKKSTFAGDIVSIVSAAIYGSYSVAFRIMTRDDLDSNIPTQVIFGYMGLINFLLLTPIVIVFFYNTFMSTTALGWVILKGLVDNVGSDYLWARAVILTSPTIANVGTTALTIPFAMITDYLLHDIVIESWLKVVGIVLLFLGFILVNSSLFSCCIKS